MGLIWIPPFDPFATIAFVRKKGGRGRDCPDRNSQPRFRQSRNPLATGHELGGVVKFIGAPMSFGRSAEIYGQGEATDYLYKVVSGTVRTDKVLADGRRQVGFYLPGDKFGLEADDAHTFSAEAIAASTCW